MAEGPAGVPRPLVTTNLKYDVVVTMSQPLFIDEEKKAIDIVDMRIRSPQQQFADWLKQSIGQVLMAVNRLARPSSWRLVNEDAKVESDAPRNELVFARPGEVQVEWTYILRGSGMGSFANTSTTAENMWKLHEVLQKGNNEPISRASAISEFDPGPATVHRVSIGTD